MKATIADANGVLQARVDHELTVLLRLNPGDPGYVRGRVFVRQVMAFNTLLTQHQRVLAHFGGKKKSTLLESSGQMLDNFVHNPIAAVKEKQQARLDPYEAELKAKSFAEISTVLDTELEKAKTLRDIESALFGILAVLR